jgi:hypothetical protein
MGQTFLFWGLPAEEGQLPCVSSRQSFICISYLQGSVGPQAVFEFAFLWLFFLSVLQVEV